LIRSCFRTNISGDGEVYIVEKLTEIVSVKTASIKEETNFNLDTMASNNMLETMYHFLHSFISDGSCKVLLTLLQQP